METSGAMGSEEERDRPTLRRGKLIVATILVALAVVLVAAILPEGLRWLALVLAFAAGIGLERFRHSFFPTPPTLRETPEAWRYLLRYEVGWGQLAIAALLLGGAAAVLFISFGSDDEAPPVATTAPPSAGPAPPVDVRREPSGREFVVNGVRFEVRTRPTALLGTTEDVGGPGDRLVFMTVEITNRSRPGFNPSELDYRLRDRQGNLYAAERSVASGSDALAQTGTLPKGDDVEQQLLFAVPPNAKALELEFEPVPTGQEQLRVPVD